MTTSIIQENENYNNSIGFSNMVKALDDLNGRIEEEKNETTVIENKYKNKIVNMDTQGINSKTLMDSYKNQLNECNELKIEVRQLLHSIEELRNENETINNNINQEGDVVEKMNAELSDAKNKNSAFKIAMIKRNILIKELKSEVVQLIENNHAYDEKIRFCSQRKSSLDHGCTIN